MVLERRRWWLLLLAALAGVVIAGRALLPEVMEQVLESQLAGRTGLSVDVGDVDLGLLRGVVALAGIRLAEPGAADALLELRGLRVRVDWWDLPRRRLHLRAIEIDGPTLRLEEGPDGVIRAPLSRAPAAEEPPATGGELAPEEAPTGEAPAGPWPVQLDVFSLRDARLLVASPDPAAEPVELDLADLSVGDLVFAGGELELGRFALREPSLRVSRAFLLRPHGGEPSEGPEAEAPAAEAPELRARIERLSMESSELTLVVADHRAVKASLRVEAETVSLREGPFPVRVELASEGGSLTVDGRLGLQPLVFDGRISWTDLSLPPLAVAARPELAQWVRSCQAAGEVAIAFDESGLRLSDGHARVDALDIASPGEEPEVRVAWDSLSLDLRELSLPLAGPGDAPAPLRIEVAAIALTKPRLRYVQPAPSLAALRGEPDAAGPAPAEAAADGAPPLVVVDALDVTGGELEFEDRTLASPYRGRLRDLELRVRDLRWPEGRAQASLRLRPPKGQSLELEASLDGKSAKADLDLKRLALPPLNPYSVPAGYRLEQGSLSLESRVRRQGGRVESTNRLELDDLGVAALDAARFEERFGMPLDLALALLRQPGGSISLTVPLVVEPGEAADAGLTRIVTSALRQALVGAVTSPLRMAGFALSVAGGGGISADPIACASGSPEPRAGQEERIVSLVGLLAERPGLGLVLRGRAGAADRAALAERLLVERVVAGEGLPDLEDAGLLAPGRVKDALRERAEGGAGELSPGDQALLERYLAAVEVPDERFAVLARERAEALRAQLAEHDVASERVTLGKPAKRGKPGVVLRFRAG